MTIAKDILIYNLFRLLDNIDTASDICKDNDKCYRELVHKYQSERWNFINQQEVDRLYNLDYNGRSDLE